MQINEHDLSTLDQMVGEISLILARGYLQYEKAGLLPQNQEARPQMQNKSKIPGCMQRKDLIVSAGRAFMRRQVNAFYNRKVLLLAVTKTIILLGDLFMAPRTFGLEGLANF